MREQDSAVASRLVPERRSRRSVLAAWLGSILGLVAMTRDHPTQVRHKDNPDQVPIASPQVPVDRLTSR